jgi:hypothetical protein
MSASGITTITVRGLRNASEGVTCVVFRSSWVLYWGVRGDAVVYRVLYVGGLGGLCEIGRRGEYQVMCFQVMAVLMY